MKVISTSDVPVGVVHKNTPIDVFRKQFLTYASQCIEKLLISERKTHTAGHLGQSSVSWSHTFRKKKQLIM